MTLLLRTSEVVKLPVVTIRGGEDVGEVRDIVYSAEQGHIIGLTLNKRGFLRGRLREVLPAENIHAIGRDAVMIEDETSALVPPDEAPPEVAEPQVDRDVLGAEVVTDAGVRLGTVTDLIIRAGERGEVVGYEVRREGSKESWLIPRPAQLAVSGDALLVPNDIEQYARTDLSSFDDAVTSYRDEECNR